MKAPVFDIYKGTTHDGPGIRDTVFFKGCPMSCRWCHNPEGIDKENHMWYENRSCIGCGLCVQTCNHRAIELTDSGIEISQKLCRVCGSCANVCPTRSISAVAKEYSTEELSVEIIKDKEYFTVSGGGVTASGGEAMMHADFLRSFFSEMKKHGIDTALDTTGLCDSGKLLEVLKYTDTVLYDLKVLNPILHKGWTGVDNKVILDNIIRVADYIKEGNNLKLWIRTPIIPGFTDRERIISDIADFIKRNLSGTVDRWELCAFNNSCVHKYEKLGKKWEFASSNLISKKTMTVLASVAEKSGVREIVCSGITTE